jgi:hypothetical protein
VDPLEEDELVVRGIAPSGSLLRDDLTEDVEPILIGDRLTELRDTFLYRCFTHCCCSFIDRSVRMTDPS